MRLLHTAQPPAAVRTMLGLFGIQFHTVMLSYSLRSSASVVFSPDTYPPCPAGTQAMTACCQPCQSCALRHVPAWLPAWLAAWLPCQRPTDLMATILHPHPTATGAGPMRGATSSSCCAAQCRMMVTVTGLDSAFEARRSWICAVAGFEATHLCGCAELTFS